MKILTRENVQEFLSIKGIYRITINNKFYIGSSSSIGYRLKHHLWSLTNNKHHNRTMQNLFNKYGKDLLYFNIEEECEIDDLINRERYHIDDLNPYINHIRNPVKIERDEIYRKRLSEAAKKRFQNERPHNERKVYKYSKEGKYLEEYRGVTEAALKLGISGCSAISQVARNKLGTAYGYRWDYEKLDSLTVLQKNYKLIPVVQFTLQGQFMKEWRSATEATEVLGVSNISRAINKNKSAGGFLWQYKS